MNNQKPLIEEQTKLWQNEKGQQDKHINGTKNTTQQTKD
jgi:hypothetical protein